MKFRAKCKNVICKFICCHSTEIEDDIKKCPISIQERLKILRRMGTDELIELNNELKSLSKSKSSE